MWRRIINIDFAYAALWQVRSLSRFDRRLIKRQHGGEPQHFVMVSDQFEGLSVHRSGAARRSTGKKFSSTCGLKNPFMVENTWSAWLFQWNKQEVSPHLGNVVPCVFSWSTTAWILWIWHSKYKSTSTVLATNTCERWCKIPTYPCHVSLLLAL